MYDIICFLSQQCIEKYLKAWLQENSVPFTKTGRPTIAQVRAFSRVMDKNNAEVGIFITAWAYQYWYAPRG